jgi:AmiR/NasT family two-component response regulator
MDADADAEQRIEQLTVALEHRTTIGTAIGMLMERLGISEEEAFAELRRVSSAHNRKLYDVACDFVRTRELPEAPPAGRSQSS